MRRVQQSSDEDLGEVLAARVAAQNSSASGSVSANSTATAASGLSSSLQRRCSMISPVQSRCRCRGLSMIFPV